MPLAHILGLYSMKNKGLCQMSGSSSGVLNNCNSGYSFFSLVSILLEKLRMVVLASCSVAKSKTGCLFLFSFSQFRHQRTTSVCRLLSSTSLVQYCRVHGESKPSVHRSTFVRHNLFQDGQVHRSDRVESWGHLSFSFPPCAEARMPLQS